MSELRILAYNDLESVYDDPHRIGRLAGLIDELRDERTILCGAGDDTALGTVALLSDHGRDLARPFFDSVAPAVETFGNHDFDQGRQWAFDWAETVPPTYCGANLDDPGTDQVPSSTVIERDDHRVGFIGVTHPEMANICGSIQDLTVGDPIPAVRREARALAQEGVDHTVVLSHCGQLDREIAARTDVDVVIGGHVHRQRCESVERTTFVRTEGGGRTVADVRLQSNSAPSATFQRTADAPRDETIAGSYRTVRDGTDVDRQIATLKQPLQRTDSERFDGESRAGNFLADVLRHTIGSDFALFPAGSLRDGPPLTGAVTVGDIVSLAPFADPIREVSVTGRQLRAALDGAAVQRSSDRGWVRVHVSGGSVRWAADGSLKRLQIGGGLVSDDARYSVATTGWLVEVSTTFDTITRATVTAEHTPLYQAAINHARTKGFEGSTPTGRIRRD